MYNLLISIAATVIAFLAAYFSLPIKWYSALIPALIAGPLVYFLLARRSLKQLEAIVMDAQKEFIAKHMETGLAKLNDAFKLAPWQFLVAAQVHSQIGSILYMLQRFDEAKPHLEKSFVRIGQARAMLGALLYREKNYDGMTKVFEEATSYNKKDGLLWSVYAWCLDKSGKPDSARAVLTRGIAESPSDEKMKANLLALANKDRMKMKAYGQEWWAFHLESPPADFIPPSMRGQMTQRKGYRQKPQR
jgi:tetratricopeptide (TPR) repeat protein